MTAWMTMILALIPAMAVLGLEAVGAINLTAAAMFFGSLLFAFLIGLVLYAARDDAS